MKRLGYISVFMLLGMNALAQQKVVYGDAFEFTPKEFTYDGKPVLQIKADDRISLYNDEIELTREIPVAEREFKYILEYQDQKREIKSVNVTPYESLDRQFNERETFEAYLAEQEMLMDPDGTLVRKKLSENETMIYGYSDRYSHSMFFHYDYFGTKYPTIYFIYRQDVDALYRIKAIYQIEYTEWTDAGHRQEEYSKQTPLVETLYRNLDEGACHDGVEFYVSQTLFNDDEDFEYLVPRVTMLKGGVYSVLNPDVTFGQEPIILEKSECITENGRAAYTGLQVLSSSGSVVGEIDFGGNYTLDDYDPYVRVITVGGKVYLAADCVDETKDETTYCTIFYRIDKRDGSIDRINVAPREARIRQENNTIHVSLSSCDKPSVIDIYNAGGAKVASRQAKAGQENVSLDVHAPKGIYNVARVQDGSVIESRKFMLK